MIVFKESYLNFTFFIIDSGSGGGLHAVVYDGDKYICGCEHFIVKHAECKHIKEAKKCLNHT